MYSREHTTVRSPPKLREETQLRLMDSDHVPCDELKLKNGSDNLGKEQRLKCLGFTCGASRKGRENLKRSAEQNRKRRNEGADN
jgi:hypothetical protein